MIEQAKRLFAMMPTTDVTIVSRTYFYTLPTQKREEAVASSLFYLLFKT